MASTSPTSPTLGRLLAHHRGRREQGAVAEALGMSRATLSEIERGYVIPTGRTLGRLLRRYATDGDGLTPTREDHADILAALVLEAPL